MRRGLPSRLGTGPMLAALALCALLMSLAFFQHLRRGGEGMRAAKHHILPGLTLIATGPHLVVTSIETGGEAARSGVAVGDEIVAIDGRPFRSLDQAAAYLVRASGDEVNVELRDRGQVRQVTMSRKGE